jgi:hypothetical protein
VGSAEAGSIADILLPRAARRDQIATASCHVYGAQQRCSEEHSTTWSLVKLVS